MCKWLRVVEVGDISEYLQGFLGMYNGLNEMFAKIRQIQSRLQVSDVPALPEVISQ